MLHTHSVHSMASAAVHGHPQVILACIRGTKRHPCGRRSNQLAQTRAPKKRALRSNGNRGHTALHKLNIIGNITVKSRHSVREPVLLFCGRR
jgi:hypothetical protein